MTDALVTRLRAAGCVFAEDEAALLREAAADPSELEELTQQRLSGTPLEYVLGWAEFCGLRIAVAPGVFVPRRRTELLVTVTAAAMRVVNGPMLLDLCCGSGAVAAALSVAAPDALVYAADIDPVAVACAAANLGASWVFQGDLFEAIPDRLTGFDAIVVNAPYVPTAAIALMPREARDYEARRALDGGSDGVEVHRLVAAQARRWLAPGGIVVVETSREQAVLTESAFTAAGFTTRVLRDDELDATAVLATRAVAD